MKFSLVGLFGALLLLSNLSEQSQYDGACSAYNVPALPFYLAAFSLVGRRFFLIAADDAGLPYFDYDCIRFFHLGGLGQISTTEKAEKQGAITTTASTSTFARTDGNFIYRTKTPSGENVVMPTKIVRTDGVTYYVEVSCEDKDGSANIYVGIFSVSPIMTADQLDAIYDFLENYGIQRSSFRNVRQNGCA